MLNKLSKLFILFHELLLEILSTMHYAKHLCDVVTHLSFFSCCEALLDILKVHGLCYTLKS